MRLRGTPTASYGSGFDFDLAIVELAEPLDVDLIENYLDDLDIDTLRSNQVRYLANYHQFYTPIPLRSGE